VRRSAMAEAVWRKADDGRWLKGRASLADGALLRWHGDDAGAGLEVRLKKGAPAKVVTFGLRKHVFEVEGDDGPVQLAAQDDAARTDWVERVAKAAGAPAAKPAGPKRVNKIAGNAKVLGLQNLLQGLPGGTTLGGAHFTPEEATKRLQDKLKGKITIQTVSEENCLVCQYLVNEEDRLAVPKTDWVVHKTCFFCNKCGQTLKEDAFMADERRHALFCPEHYEKSSDADSDKGSSPTHAAALATAAASKVGKSKPSNQDDSESESGKKAKAADEAETPSSSAPSTPATPENINHDALLSRPIVKGGRRRPMTTRINRVPVAPAEASNAEKEHHANAFFLREGTLTVFFFLPFLAEKRKWCDAVSNSLELVHLNHELEEAQRVDMLSAIQAQMNIEAFENAHKADMNGQVSVCIRKKAKDTNQKWRDGAFAVLQDRVLEVFESEVAKASGKPLVHVDLKNGASLYDAASKKQLSAAAPSTVSPPPAKPLKASKSKPSFFSVASFKSSKTSMAETVAASAASAARHAEDEDDADTVGSHPSKAHAADLDSTGDIEEEDIPPSLKDLDTLRPSTPSAERSSYCKPACVIL